MSDLQIGIGTHVELELISADGRAERMACDLVAEQAADADAGFIGANAPLARAIRGKAAGVTVAYGIADIMEIRILAVTPSSATPDDTRTSRRQAAYDEALRKAERTNAEMFASSYGSKWGGYEVDDQDQ